MESTSSAQDRASRSTIDYGVKIYDTPAMREETKKKNETLLEENTRLVERVEQLEVLLREANGVVVTDEENVSGCVVDSSNNDASGKSDDTDADF